MFYYGTLAVPGLRPVPGISLAAVSPPVDGPSRPSRCAVRKLPGLSPSQPGPHTPETAKPAKAQAPRQSLLPPQLGPSCTVLATVVHCCDSWAPALLPATR